MKFRELLEQVLLTKRGSTEAIQCSISVVLLWLKQNTDIGHVTLSNLMKTELLMILQRRSRVSSALTMALSRASVEITSSGDFDSLCKIKSDFRKAFRRKERNLEDQGKFIKEIEGRVLYKYMVVCASVFKEQYERTFLTGIS